MILISSRSEKRLSLEKIEFHPQRKQFTTAIFTSFCPHIHERRYVRFCFWPCQIFYRWLTSAFSSEKKKSYSLQNEFQSSCNSNVTSYSLHGRVERNDLLQLDSCFVPLKRMPKSKYFVIFLLDRRPYIQYARSFSAFFTPLARPSTHLVPLRTQCKNSPQY